jgi:hypothetical protein
MANNRKVKKLIDKKSTKERSEELKEELRIIKIDAVAAIFSNHNNAFLKLVWLLVLIGCACICVLLVVKSVKEYLQYDVTTHIRVFSEQRSEFPVITICSDNPFTSSFADDLFRQANLTNKRGNINDLMLFVKQTTGEYLGLSQLLNMSDMNDFLIGCTFLGKKCTAKDFEPSIYKLISPISIFTFDSFRPFFEKKVYHPKYHICYRYNSGRDIFGNLTEIKSVSLTGYNSKRFYVIQE